MPIDYKKYPPNWKDIRARILRRANNCCEFCGVKNYAVGFRDKVGNFIEIQSNIEDETFYLDTNIKVIKIVLTVAHLDHDEFNHNITDDRLKALCQRCHLLLDIKEKKRRRFNKKHKHQLNLTPFLSMIKIILYFR